MAKNSNKASNGLGTPKYPAKEDETKKETNEEIKEEIKETDKQKENTDNKFTGENFLELHSMTKKQKRQARKDMYNEYTSGMSKTQKLGYFFDYYKWYIIIPIVCICLITYLGITIYKNSRPVALSYVVLNASDPNEINKAFEDDYVSNNNITGDFVINSKLNMTIDFEYYKEHVEYIQTGTSTDYNILASSCELGDYDIIITDENGLKYCSNAQIAHSLKGYLDSYAYSKLQDYMFDSLNYYGEYEPYAIDISNTEFAKSLNLGYDDVYLAFPGVNSRNKKNALRLVEFALNIDVTEE